MIIQYILAGISIISLLALLRTNYILEKEATDSLKFWQQRFNIVAADYQELAKINEELNESTKLLSKEVFNCEFNRRNK
ncbi:MAG: hypothetical protein QG556_844 [Pseudomonadota bacterium]|nr:hypothetical protein [Pseudomonadota bacterium]